MEQRYRLIVEQWNRATEETGKRRNSRRVEQRNRGTMEQRYRLIVERGTEQQRNSRTEEQ